MILDSSGGATKISKWSKRKVGNANHGPGCVYSTSRPYGDNSSAASSSASINLPRNTSVGDLQRHIPPSPLYDSTPRHSPTPSVTITPEQPAPELLSAPIARGRSLSREESTASPTASAGGDQGSGAFGNRKIRFAPLPEARPRSYSTGRNIWLDAEDMSDGLRQREENEDGPRRWMFRRDHQDNFRDESPFGAGESAIDDEDDDDAPEEEEGPLRGLFGSWKSDNSFGRSGSSTGNNNKENEESYTSKLLRPLAFGLAKKKNKKRPSSSDGNPSSLPSHGEGSFLSRMESTDSELSRVSSGGGHSIRSSSSISRSASSAVGGGGNTGIPMRKTRTWESGDTNGGSRRANYPPVAQRSKSRGRPSTASGAKLSISAPDPSFVEWGFTRGGVGSVGAQSSPLERSVGSTGKRAEDDEDGSGMAWVKRRREEKEAAKKREAEAAVEAAQKAAEDEKNGEDDGVRRPPSPISSSMLSPQVTLTQSSPSIPSAKTLAPVVGGLSSTRPSLHLITAPSNDVQKLSSDSLPLPSSGATSSSPISSNSTPSSPSSPSEEEDNDAAKSKFRVEPIRKPSLQTSSGMSTPRNVAGGGLSPPIPSYADHSAGEDDDSDEDKDGADDDSDLDEDELAEEEALAAKARMTALSAGKYLFLDLFLMFTDSFGCSRRGKIS